MSPGGIELDERFQYLLGLLNADARPVVLLLVVLRNNDEKLTIHWIILDTNNLR